MHVGVHRPKSWLGRYDYPTRFRVFEIASLLVFGAAMTSYLVRLSSVVPRLHRSDIPVLVGLCVAALLIVDFLSGLVHFLCDNLGSQETPIVGRKFIKSFRDHHLDPVAMTRDDFVAVNADNFTLSLPLLIPTALWLDVDRHLYLAWFVMALVGFVVITNQAHKWAHLDEPPKLAQLLQRGFLLSPNNHCVHHMAPHDRNYCITSGVLNPILSRLGFWPWLLRVLRRE